MNIFILCTGFSLLVWFYDAKKFHIHSSNLPLAAPVSKLDCWLSARLIWHRFYAAYPSLCSHRLDFFA